MEGVLRRFFFSSDKDKLVFTWNIYLSKVATREVWKLGVDESRFTEQQYTSSQLDDISLRYSSRSQCMQQSGVCVG